MDLWIFAGLIAVSAVAAMMIYRSLRKAADLQRAFAKHASINGWTCTVVPATWKTGASTVFTDPDDDWTMTYQITAEKHRNLGHALTWHCSHPALAQGAAVYRPRPAPQKAIGSILKGAITHLLQSKDTPHAIDPHLKPVRSHRIAGTLWATKGQEHSMDSVVMDDLWSNMKWRNVMVIYRPTGLTLRQGVSMTSMDLLTDLAKLGLRLRQRLDP